MANTRAGACAPVHVRGQLELLPREPNSRGVRVRGSIRVARTEAVASKHPRALCTSALLNVRPSRQRDRTCNKNLRKIRGGIVGTLQFRRFVAVSMATQRRARCRVLGALAAHLTPSAAAGTAEPPAAPAAPRLPALPDIPDPPWDPERDGASQP